MSNVTPISFVGAASAFPERIVGNDFFGSPGSSKSPMFRGARQRHHLQPGQTAVQLVTEACAKLEARLGRPLADGLDIILTNVSIPDMPFTGCGAEVARELGVQPQWVFDLHNYGCISFIPMAALAQSLMTTTGARRALVCNVQTAGGRIFSDPKIRRLSQAAIPGDGCGVALLEAGNSRPIENIIVRNFPAFASDMQIAGNGEAQWWEPREDQFSINFSRAKIARVVGRANRMVPEVIQACCDDAGLAPADIHTLITNQPNPGFLRNWRDALQVPAERHIDTFAEHGNLFGAAMPVCLARAEEAGTLEHGSNVVLGGFSHAGDYTAAAVIRWTEAA